MEWVSQFHKQVETARDAAHAEWARLEAERRRADAVAQEAKDKLNSWNTLLHTLSDLAQGLTIPEPPL